MENQLVKPKIFNLGGSDSYESQAILGGNPTGIANLNNVRYPWVQTIMREMLGNFWIPQKVGLEDDKPSMLLLTEHEDESFRRTLSFLTFLDNVQVANLPNIAEFITNPAIRNLLAVHAFQEVIHSESYQYGLLTFYPSTERDQIYNLWRTDEPLRERNLKIARIAEEFQEDKSPDSFKKVIVANLALEGIYFYSGFNFFDNLAHRNRAVQWNKVIDYIRKDEATHKGIFVNLIRELDVSENIILPIIEDAVVSEYTFAKYNYGNRILGISEASSEEHAKWLGNDCLQRLGIGPIWDNVRNPYQHILDSQKVGGNRKNFFETTVTDYDVASSIDGWDDF